jgi:hypothetical protein
VLILINPSPSNVKKLPNMIFFSLKLQSKKNAAAASASTSSTTPVVTEFTVSKTFQIFFIRQCLASFSLDNLDYDYYDGFTIILTQMPCPFTSRKMFCTSPNFLSQHNNLTAFSASQKLLCRHKNQFY